MFNMSKRTRSALLWAGCFAALFLYMYLRHGYVFPFIEQNRMFMWDGGHILRRIAECGGAAAVARDFLLQFFIEPWGGALIAALLLVKTGVATQWTLERVVPGNGALLLWLAPVAAQIFLMVDYDYRYEGIVAWLAAWGLFSLFVCAGGGAAVRAVAASAASLAAKAPWPRKAMPQRANIPKKVAIWA